MVAVIPTSGPAERSVARIAVPDAARELVTIVIPAFNEGEGIGAVLGRLKEELGGQVAEIIVVDDGSTDGTAEAAAATGVRVISHPNNRGYGAALKTGIRAARTELILTMDADGQHRLEDVAALCEAACAADRPECVIGQRTSLLHSPLWRMPGKWFLTMLAQFLTEKKIPDLNSGLRVMSREVALRYMRICPQGFSFSTTITMALLSRGYAVRFVPIEVQRRTGRSTVKIKTGFQTILLVIRLATLFNPLRIFLPMSAISLLGGIGWGIPYAIAGEGITVASMLLIMTATILFALGLICDQIAQLRIERFE
jgi:glycosyltransferase involved in cell wall biosynthesis